MNRRSFISHATAVSLAAAFTHRAWGMDGERRPRILLRSSWQCVNIGDIAHTPGVLALLERHIPGAEVVLWSSNNLTDEVAAMEHRRFPQLRIVKGTIRSDGSASNRELTEAVQWADFLLHGSGPSLVAAKDVAAFSTHTGKPFGVYGITFGPPSADDETVLLSKAEFVFFRDTVSLEYAKQRGVQSPIMEFAPDGAFGCDLRNDLLATSFLERNQLKEGKFLCCLSRLRHTPYWRIPNDKRQRNESYETRNEAMKVHDHAPLLEAIIRVVQETDLKILLCPEDMTQMAVGKEMLYDALPNKIKSRVVWRDSFWLTDEALSVYAKSAGLFGSEMHSPIMAVGNGIPAIVCRFKEQTSKGFMWRDIGLEDWLFDLDIDAEASRVAEAVVAMAKDFEAAKAKIEPARAFIRKRQEETMAVLKNQPTFQG